MLATLSRFDTIVSHPDAGRNISLLLEAGANPDAMTDPDGDSPSYSALSMPAWGNDREAAKILIDAGANLDQKDSHGNTAFVTASRSLSGNVADLLFCRGSVPVLMVLWGLYALVAALPFFILKNNASRFFVKGKNIRKTQAYKALMEIVLVLVLESTPLWAPLVFQNEYIDVRRSVPLMARLCLLLLGTADQLYFLLVQSRKIASLGEGIQKRPRSHVVVLVFFAILCAYAFSRSTGR
jgi:hypothetical protein